MLLSFFFVYGVLFVMQDHKGISNVAPADAPLRSLSIPKAESESELEEANDVGEARIHDYISNLQFRISPMAFFQVLLPFLSIKSSLFLIEFGKSSSFTIF